MFDYLMPERARLSMEAFVRGRIYGDKTEEQGRVHDFVGGGDV